MFSVRTAIMNKKLSLTHLFAFRRLPVFGSNYLINFNQRYYHENVIDHFEKPRNVGAMNPKDKNVGTGLVGAPACGDVMKLQIKVNEATNKIEKAVFKTFGCGSAIASSSYATEILHGMDLDEAMNIKNKGNILVTLSKTL